MARHSHFHNIGLKKGAADKKRGKAFTKHARYIAIAAQEGGSGDPESNPLLRMAIENARADNLPKDNIDRAIKKGTGADKEGMHFEEGVYEVFAPGGVGLLVSVLTDNKNRALGEIRKVVLDFEGRIAESGSIAWMFEQKGQVRLEARAVAKQLLTGHPDVRRGRGDRQEDELAIIDSGAEDFEELEADEFLVYSKPQELGSVRKFLEAAGFKVKSSELGFVPKNTVTVEDKAVAQKVLDFIDALDELDDVTKIAANLYM